MGGFSIITAQNLLNSAPILGEFLGNGFRPPNWSQPQLTSISVVLPSTQTESVSHNITGDDGAPLPGATSNPTTKQTPNASQSTTYFFDAIMRVGHDQDAVVTEHPIQSGASISDHIYLVPARVELEIGMSDVLDSYVSGQYSDNSSKSVSAYQKLLYLQGLGVPLTVTTRLNTYNNMVIESIRADDSVETLYGLRARVRFKQIIVGTVSVTTQSARPNASDSTNPGAAQPEAIPAELQKYTNASGQWSSTPITSPPTTLFP